jgi:hypothetical protein
VPKDASKEGYLKQMGKGPKSYAPTYITRTKEMRRPALTPGDMQYPIKDQFKLEAEKTNEYSGFHIVKAF